jgi:hypothetical protein
VDITTGYLLIDVANLPELDCEPINLIGCVPPALTNYQELMPCLVAVDEMSLTQRQQLIKILEYQRASEHGLPIISGPSWCSLGLLIACWKNLVSAWF